MFEYFCLTAKGAALLAKAQTGETLTFTRFQIGDGEIPVGAAMSDTAALVHPLMYLQIAGLTHSGSTATIKTTFANAGASSDFWWREVGLLAQDPVEGEILYAYANAGDKADHIPAPSSTAVSFAFAMIAKVDNAKQVSAVIDPSVVFVTDKMLKDYATKSDLAQALEEKAPLVHTHGLSDVTGLDEALSAKADKSHKHAASDIQAGTLGGKVQANAAAAAALSEAQVRNIRAQTANLTAGTSPLANGEVVLVYE